MSAIDFSIRIIEKLWKSLHCSGQDALKQLCPKQLISIGVCSHQNNILLQSQQLVREQPEGVASHLLSCGVQWGPGIKCRLFGLVENTFLSEPSYWLERVWTSLYITGFGFLGCLLIAHSKGWIF